MARRQSVDVDGLIAEIHAEAVAKGVARTENTAMVGTENGHRDDGELKGTGVTPSKGKRTGPPRPVSERQIILHRVWNLVLSGRSYTDIVELLEDELGLAETVIASYYSKCKQRLDTVADQRLADIWVRQVARLEDSALEAKAVGKYEAQSMLEGVLMKVAGTGAPEKILHKHEHVLVDKRAEEIHAELQAIRANTEGPLAIAHQVTDTGLADPKLGTLEPEHRSAIANTVGSPTNTAPPITERAVRGRRPSALSAAFSKKND